MCNGLTTGTAARRRLSERVSCGPCIPARSPPSRTIPVLVQPRELQPPELHTASFLQIPSSVAPPAMLRRLATLFAACKLFVDLVNRAPLSAVAGASFFHARSLPIRRQGESKCAIGAPKRACVNPRMLVDLPTVYGRVISRRQEGEPSSHPLSVGRHTQMHNTVHSYTHTHTSDPAWRVPYSQRIRWRDLRVSLRPPHCFGSLKNKITIGY